MKQCGSNRWWLDDAKLVIRRQRRASDILKGLGLLSLSAGLVWLMRSDVNLELVVYVLAGVGLGLYCLLGTWEVTLHRVSERASWRWGLGLPLFSRSKVVADTDRVQLVTPKGTVADWRLNAYSIHLIGVSESNTLAGSDDHDEALELAESVARHMRRGLQVDAGRVRSFEELVSPERARAVSELEARLRGPAADSALASTSPVEPPFPPPPGCRVQVREEGEQRMVVLPAPGWVGGFRLRAGFCAVLMLAPVVLAGYIASRYGSWRWPALLSPFLLIPTVLSGSFLLQIRESVHSAWRITVSRRGLELESAGPQMHPPTRWAAGLIQDVDVREQMGDTIRVSEATTPMLVIARRDGKTVALGQGLPREELEWAAARIRQELTALTGDRSPAPAE